MANWDTLESTVWIVPSINLPAAALINIGSVDPVVPLVDQTVWVFDSVDDGTVIGRSTTNVGGGWTDYVLFGTISDDGDVVFAFLPDDGVTVDPGSGVEIAPLTVGRGTMVELDGEWTFAMQMTSGNGIGSVTHWAYMVEAEPSDRAYGALPGYRDTAVPDVVDGVPPPEPPSGDPLPSPDPATIAVWTALEDTYWIVPTANLPAQVLAVAGASADETVTLPVADQTVWHFETIVDGYVVGRVMANFGGGWSSQILVGSITPEGAVSFSFTPEDPVVSGPDGIEVQSIIVGIGNVVDLDGEQAFLMQMNSGEGAGSIAHWAYMVEATPDDIAYAALPGYEDTGIPDLFDDAPPAAADPEGEIATPDPAAIAALGALEGTSWLLPRGGNDAMVLRNGPSGPQVEAVDVSLALRIETVRDGYIVGTVMVTAGGAWTSYGVTGSVMPDGAVYLLATGEDASFNGIVGEIRDTGDGPVLDLQFAAGSSVFAQAANFTLLPAVAATPVDNPNGAIGATIGYLFDGVDGSLALTDGSDRFLGLSNDERVEARGGDDVVHGRGGDDTLIGGVGDDTLVGGGGADRLGGDDGDDRLQGWGGDDVASGGDGFDRLAGQRGDDDLVGGGRGDTVYGGAGDDTLSGGAGCDTVAGGAGDDLIRGGRGDDLVAAGPGADTLDGGAGDDWIRLGPADGAEDRVIFADSDRGIGNDTVSGFEDGIDLIDLSGVSAVTGFGSLAISDRAGGTLVEFGAYASVFLKGVAAASIAADDFIF